MVLPTSSDTFGHVLVCAVLGDYLSALRSHATQEELRKQVTDLAVRRSRWLPIVQVKYTQWQQSRDVTKITTSFTILERFSTASSETSAKLPSQSKWFKKLGKGVKSAPLLSKLKGNGRNSGLEKGPPETNIPVTGTSSENSSDQNLAGKVASRADQTEVVLNRGELNGSLLEEVAAQLRVLKRDRRNQGVSLQILEFYLDLLTEPQIRRDLLQSGSVEDLAWLYGKVALRFGVVELVPVGRKPPCTPTTTLVTKRTTLFDEMMVILSVIKIALAKVLDSHQVFKQQNSDSVPLNTIASGTPQKLANGPLERLVQRTDWVSYVLVDYYEPGPLVGRLHQIFGMTHYSVLERCQGIGPVNTVRTFSTLFRSYHIKLFHDPVPLDRVTHSYSPAAYEYWLGNERRMVQGLTQSFGEAETRLLQCGALPTVPGASQTTSVGLPGSIALPSDPHPHYAQLCECIVTQNVANPLHQLSDREALEMFKTLLGQPGPVSNPNDPSPSAKFTYCPLLVPPEVRSLLVWCGDVWCLSLAFRMNAFLQALLQRIPPTHSLLAHFLGDAVGFTNHLLNHVPHTCWSHSDNDNTYSYLMDIYRYAEAQLDKVLEPIDFYPELHDIDQLPQLEATRLGLKLYHFKSVMRLWVGLGHNPILHYYQPDLAQTLDKLEKTFGSKIRLWYTFWKNQYGFHPISSNTKVTEDQRPTTALTVTEVLCALANTWWAFHRIMLETVSTQNHGNQVEIPAGKSALLVEENDFQSRAERLMTTLLTHTLGLFERDVRQWLEVDVNPLQDVEACIALYRTLQTICDKLTSWDYPITGLRNWSYQFARCFMAKFVDTVQTKSTQWTTSVLAVDQPIHGHDDLQYSSSADDILCCIFEPFDIIKSIDTVLEPDTHTWAVTCLTSTVYTVLEQYCSAMQERFLRSFQGQLPDIGAHSPMHIAESALPTGMGPVPESVHEKNGSKQGQPGKDRMDAWLKKAAGKLGPKSVVGTGISPSVLSFATSNSILVGSGSADEKGLDIEACQVLNNLFKISQRLYELFSPYLPGDIKNGHALVSLSSPTLGVATDGVIRSDQPGPSQSSEIHPTAASNMVYYVVVHVIHAEGIELRRQTRPRNVYAKLGIKGYNLKIGKTTTKTSTMVPRWDEPLDLWVGGTTLYTRLGSAVCTGKPTFREMGVTAQVALYDRDKPHSSSLFALGYFHVNPVTDFSDQQSTRDVWVELQPKGKMLVRLTLDSILCSASYQTSVEGKSVDSDQSGSHARVIPVGAKPQLSRLLAESKVDGRTIQRTYFQIEWLLRRALNDLMRQTVEYMVPHLQRYLTRTKLVGDIGQSPTDLVAKFRGKIKLLRGSARTTEPMRRQILDTSNPNSISTAVTATGSNGEDTTNPLAGLFTYLNQHMAVVFSGTYQGISRPLLLGIWREVNRIMEDLILPSLLVLQKATDPLAHAKLKHATVYHTPPSSPKPSTLQLWVSSMKPGVSKPKNKFYWEPETLSFLYECLDAIQWFFTGGDSAEEAVIPLTVLKGTCESRRLAFIQTHYHTPTPQLVRAYMHAVGQQLDTVKQWQPFAQCSNTRVDGHQAKRASLKVDHNMATGLADVIGAPLVEYLPLSSENGSNHPVDRNPSPGSTETNPEPRDDDGSSDDDQSTLVWSVTKTQLILRILQTRYDRDPEAAMFVQSHQDDQLALQANHLGTS
ncbi:hypothetical protein IWQ61_001584 [Dispira simplex]|nr:hypothetical protein IWQ61_001584 [Dispira simplex]